MNSALKSEAVKPAFLISIDTEGDNIWSKPKIVTTHNAKFLPRFQSLCEKHGFKPTYLTNHEMALSDDFHRFGLDALKRGTAEIGMHMHAWDTPPLEPLGTQDWHSQPYATEYSAELVARKATFMTRLLEDRFSRKITSHRAGRWGFSSTYAQTLADLGYEADCSVTPGVTWQPHAGHPGGRGGVDFTHFPVAAYRLDMSDISKPGNSTLIELPMTIIPGKRPLHRAAARFLLGRKGARLDWLSPKGDNLADMLALVQKAADERRNYIQFTLHSSEFMPGGSPTFPDGASIESLYQDLETLFARIARSYRGAGLTEFARHIAPSL